MDLNDANVWENNYYYLNGDVCVFYVYYRNDCRQMRDHSFDHVNVDDEKNEMFAKMFHVLNDENFEC